jgi:hypothetical protein
MNNKSDEAILVIRDLLHLNSFSNELKNKIRSEQSIVEVSNKLRNLAAMHPDKYRLEYQNTKNNPELVLLEKKTSFFFTIWEEVTRLSALSARSHWPSHLS